MINNFSAIILDMDGLLLDTESVYALAWQSAGEKMGYAVSAEYCDSLRGCAREPILQSLQATFGAGFDIDQFMALSTEFWFQHVSENGVEPMPGARLLLDYMQQQQIDYALATNSPRHISEHSLLHSGLADAFSIRVSRDDVSEPKPAPHIYQLASQRLGYAPEHCLCVEDSETGLLSAVRAGCQTVWVDAAGAGRLSGVDNLYQQHFHSLVNLVTALSASLER